MYLEILGFNYHFEYSYGCWWGSCWKSSSSHGMNDVIWFVLWKQLQPCTCSAIWKGHKDEVLGLFHFASVFGEVQKAHLPCGAGSDNMTLRGQGIGSWRAPASKLQWHFTIHKVRWLILFKKQYKGQQRHGNVSFRYMEKWDMGVFSFVLLINTECLWIKHFLIPCSNARKKLCCWPTLNIKVKVS